MKVQVYYNLNKKCLSVRHKGKVIKHCDTLVLTDADFRVQPAGRAKVLREKRKNVHAYISGTLSGKDLSHIHKGKVWESKRHVVYNPYKYKTFVDKSTLEPITKAEVVHIMGKTITTGDYN